MFYAKTIIVFHILTGIKIDENLALKVRGSKFDFGLGTIESDEITLTATLNDQMVENGDYPLVDPSKDFKLSKKDQSLHFSQSNLVYDAGQSILPFFDSQNTDMEFPAPLSGVQLINYFTSGYAGFIKPRIYTINYADYLDDMNSSIIPETF